MAEFFNFYDPLEKRYIFNSFLVVVVLVEILILGFTLVWQIDEGIFSSQVKVVPFPWKEYLLASFAAPIALLFLYGLIVRGFQAFAGEEGDTLRGRWWPGQGKKWKISFFLILAGLLGLLTVVFFGGGLLNFLTRFTKGLGLGGTYLLVALIALAGLYVSLRLLLNYRLKKKALEYQYLTYLAERHGLLPFDPHDPELRRYLTKTLHSDNKPLPSPSSADSQEE